MEIRLVPKQTLAASVIPNDDSGVEMLSISDKEVSTTHIIISMLYLIKD